MHPEVVVIIPVYNEVEVIADVIKKVTRQFKNVICIDDGSVDGSGDVIAKTKTTLITHPLNLGQGAALQTGIDYALQTGDYEYFVTYDSDGQHDLKDVQFMLDTIKKKKVDIVLGSRFLGKAENITWVRQTMLRLALIFSNRTTGVRLTDTHNGLRVFNRKVAAQLDITMPDFAHASEIIERIAHKKFTYEEVPVTILYTDYSRRNAQPILNSVNIGFDMLLTRITRKR
jgi:polyprenyl-phospho-N-acetylgalactosaminyl synthase